jgi:hypothetical protein
MAFTAADIPARIDVLIDGQGYVFDDTLDTSTVYSTRQRMQAGLTPTFIQRQNVSGDFGDNQQDFFLTFTQRDWSEGEQQRFFRQADGDSQRRYWQGEGVDIRIPGQVSMRAGLSSVTFGSAPVACGPAYAASGGTKVPVASATNLLTVDSALAVVDLGAHSLPAAPRRWAMAADGINVYVSALDPVTNAGKIRKWNGTTFSDFAAATGASSLAFLNNTLYGLRDGAGELARWDTAGTLTSLFLWKNALGNLQALGDSKLVAFGGKLAILRQIVDASGVIAGGPELWIYDGTGTSIIAQLPVGFLAYDIAVSQGTIFISGTMPLASGGSTTSCPVIFYWVNGSLGMLWRSYVASTIAPALLSWNGGLLFTDPARTALMYWDAAVGGVQTISASWLSSGNISMSGTGFIAVAVNGTTTGKGFQDSGTRLSASTVTTSLADFDSSLTKNFHGVTVEFDSASDGNGGTVDVAYRIGDVDGSYTSIVTGATSGTEISLSGVAGKSISIKVTLNKGTSTNGPVLKRISVRGSPQEPSYSQTFYTIACYGTDRASPPTRQPLRDGTHMDKSGLQMVADLRTSAAKTAPISITDEVNGTYTGVIMPETLNIDRMRPGEFRVQFTARSV